MNHQSIYLLGTFLSPFHASHQFLDTPSMTQDEELVGRLTASKREDEEGEDESPPNIISTLIKLLIDL